MYGRMGLTSHQAWNETNDLTGLLLQEHFNEEAVLAFWDPKRSDNPLENGQINRSRHGRQVAGVDEAIEFARSLRWIQLPAMLLKYGKSAVNKFFQGKELATLNQNSDSIASQLQGLPSDLFVNMIQTSKQIQAWS